MTTQHISESEVPQILKRPKRKLIEWKDYFTSTDEALDEIIRGLNHVIYRLDLLIDALAGVKAPVSTPTAPTLAAVAPPVQLPRPIMALPQNYKLTRTFNMVFKQKQRIMLHDDYFIITPDNDVIIYETEGAQGFKVRGGSYYGLSRSPDFKELWIEPVSPPTAVYISFYKVM
jgi:hypothetical protein